MSVKSREHQEAMVALFIAWYNFVRKHSTLKTTPAAAHGLTDRAWSIEELLNTAARN